MAVRLSGVQTAGMAADGAVLMFGKEGIAG